MLAHTNTHAHTHTCLGVYKSADNAILYVCMYVCMHACMYVCMYVYTRTHPIDNLNTKKDKKCTDINAGYIHIYSYIHAHTFIYTHIHVYIYVPG